MQLLLLTSLYQVVKCWQFPLLLIVVVLLLGWIQIYWDRKRNLLHIPGPTPLPIIGNAHLLAGPAETFMSAIYQLMEKHGRIVRIHLGSRPNVAITSAQAFEKILSSNKHISKGEDYRFLWDWLGLGLLTSTGAKWHTRRKMLTPAFHFRILDNFADVMNRQSSVLCDLLAKKADTNQEFDVFPLITHCALDIICETAMGRSINAQENSDTDYVRAIYRSSDLVFLRQRSPWLWNDWVYRASPAGRESRRHVDLMHRFTEQVIRERRQELMEDDSDTFDAVDELGRKKKVAFLDLLIRESKGGLVLSDQDIREEVDTFMFEGHDTTAANMTFSLFLLASHPEIQRQCQEELDNLFQGSDREVTHADLSGMKYLECCIKESLRLYQSVPIMSRTTGEDVHLDGYLIPANTNIILINFALHRDPEMFPDPDRFDPGRFSSDNPEKRHVYSYVPFSAGPRNCIGQKFAVMEEKIVLSSILRKFNLKCTTDAKDIPLLPELILRPKNGIHLSCYKRS